MTITVEHLPNSVALVTLSAETSRNGLNMESIKSMSDVIDNLLEDSSIKSIVMTGTGKFFCSGADIDSFASAIDDGSISDLVGGLTSILHPMELKIRAFSRFPAMRSLCARSRATWALGRGIRAAGVPGRGE